MKTNLPNAAPAWNRPSADTISRSSREGRIPGGPNVAMIDRTYGHLAAGADDYERDLLDALDVGRSG